MPFESDGNKLRRSVRCCADGAGMEHTFRFLFSLLVILASLSLMSPKTPFHGDGIDAPLQPSTGIQPVRRMRELGLTVAIRAWDRREAYTRSA
jgi:hypothetical protein